MSDGSDNSIHDFDRLDELALKSNAEIEALASGDAFSLVERIEASLVSRPLGKVDRTNFVSRLRTLRELRRSGSRALGDAILEASKFVDNGQIAEARKVYENFLSGCDSPFYRKIAQQQLKKLDPSRRT